MKKTTYLLYKHPTIDLHRLSDLYKQLPRSCDIRVDGKATCLEKDLADANNELAIFISSKLADNVDPIAVFETLEEAEEVLGNLNLKHNYGCYNSLYTFFEAYIVRHVEDEDEGIDEYDQVGDARFTEFASLESDLSEYERATFDYLWNILRGDKFFEAIEQNNLSQAYADVWYAKLKANEVSNGGIDSIFKILYERFDGAIGF